MGSDGRQLRELSARLTDAGDQGKGLRRDLYQAISEAAKPLAAKVGSTANLYPHMPDHYAGTLAADLAVTVTKRGGTDPSVSIRAKGRAHKRKVAQLDAGVIVHPVYPRGTDLASRRRWKWSRQTSGMKAGFFTDVMKEGVPDVRRKVLAAMQETGRKITS